MTVGLIPVGGLALGRRVYWDCGCGCGGVWDGVVVGFTEDEVLVDIWEHGVLIETDAPVQHRFIRTSP